VDTPRPSPRDAREVQYEVHNRLDNHHEALLGGLVTNVSLYLAMADAAD